MRREGWEREKTREIKEVTIKGLEPEVERILQNQRTERRKADDKHRLEIERIKEEVNQEKREEMKRIKDQMEASLERALQQE
jgi:5-azacytidine-induced protein 1